MKRILILFCAVGIALAASASPVGNDMQNALAAVRAAIDAAEASAPGSQSLDEINDAARDQIVLELKLTKSQLKQFEPLYKAYRAALDKAVDAEAATGTGSGEAAERNRLKAKLANISATAQVKREYVDKFAAILTAEQIRRLYNAEGQIGTSIKRAAGKRPESVTKLRGSGRKTTQDWGPAGAYTSIQASSFIDITVSPTARTIAVTADDNVIDYIQMERNDGKLNFRLDTGTRSRSLENIAISIVVPASDALREIRAGSYGKVTCNMPLKGTSASVSVSSYGSVKADIDVSGALSLDISSYGKFAGSVRCNNCDFDLSSYGSASAPIHCRTHCEMNVGSYAKFTDEVKAAELTIRISSGASVGSALVADDLTLTVGSYAKFSGSVQCKRAKLSVQSGGSFSGSFAGNTLDAEVSSYGKLALKGSARVVSASVQVSSGAVFSAPDLQVTDYDLKASSYAKADVRCSGTLKIDAANSSNVTYDGPCTVEALSRNIRRKK